MNDRELISKAIEASGLSVRRFARDVLVREPRTVWRWLAGENSLPLAVREKAEAIVVDLGKLYPAAGNEPIAVFVTMTEPHPLGGVTPMKATDKGDVSAECPSCGEILVRDATPRALAMVSVVCPKCHTHSVGALHPYRAAPVMAEESEASDG
jgi:predicted RNA-binding Zn-ribbon protein involved in translation (DUF1610 family)